MSGNDQSKIFTTGFSGGIETLVRGAEEERAQIAAQQNADVQSADVAGMSSDHRAEVDATRAYLTEALKLAHEKYTKSSPLLRNELCIVEQAIENTLGRITSLFYRE